MDINDVYTCPDIDVIRARRAREKAAHEKLHAQREFSTRRAVYETLLMQLPPVISLVGTQLGKLTGVTTFKKQFLFKHFNAMSLEELVEKDDQIQCLLIELLRVHIIKLVNELVNYDVQETWKFVMRLYKEQQFVDCHCGVWKKMTENITDPLETRPCGRF